MIYPRKEGVDSSIGPQPRFAEPREYEETYAAGEEGEARLASVTLSGPDGEVQAPAQMLVCSTGRQGRAVPGLPFDEARGIIPSAEGRVIDPATGEPLQGAYVVGWAKRGAKGGIGANRACAGETVTSLLADAADGSLRTPTRKPKAFASLLSSRQPRLVRSRGVSAIEAAEQKAGRAAGRPRVKLTTIEDLLGAAGRR